MSNNYYYNKAPLPPETEKDSLNCDFAPTEKATHNENETVHDFSQSPLLDFSHVKTFGNEHCKKSAEELSAWIIANETVQSCLETLKALAMQHERDWAADDFNTALFEKIRPKLLPFLTTNERMLFYKDSGVLAKGKTGTLITSRAIYRITKKSVKILPLREVFSIHILPIFTFGTWYFNSNKDIEIDSIACSPMEQGLIMALICLLVRQEKGSGCKIRIYNGILV